jgi:hypothetical protein
MGGGIISIPPTQSIRTFRNSPIFGAISMAASELRQTLPLASCGAARPKQQVRGKTACSDLRSTRFRRCFLPLAGTCLRVLFPLLGVKVRPLSSAITKSPARSVPTRSGPFRFARAESGDGREAVWRCSPRQIVRQQTGVVSVAARRRRNRPYALHAKNAVASSVKVAGSGLTTAELNVPEVSVP